MKYKKLFSPCKIGSLTIKNRFSMAPMGLVGYSDLAGGFTKNAAEYYVERAKGGTGLLITGICNVDYTEVHPFGLPCPAYNPVMFKVSTVDMIERIHAYDSRIFLQLTGGLGRSALPGSTVKNVAPSEQKNRFIPQITHREMTVEEIHTLIDHFVESAMVAKECGFDGIEIHAVHEGYLLDQFAIAFYNHRTDEYGGSLENRLKVATDIVKGIKAKCGEDFPVSLRFSLKSFVKGYAQGGLPGEAFEEQGRDIEEGIEAAKLLEEAGYDCLNVDVGTYDSWYWNHPPMYFKKGMYREFGRILKKEVGVPVILAGRMDDPEMAEDAIDDCCDMIGYGRPLLADPYLPMKYATGQESDIRPCLSCHQACIGRLGKLLPLSCAVNPQCGKEQERRILPALVKKKIAVVGGGVAGMEAARVAALRGHDITLFERAGHLGGNVFVGGTPDFKKDDMELLNWYEKQLEKSGISICLNTEIKAESLAESDFDEIVTATGSKPMKLHFSDPTYLAEDIYLNPAKAGKRVVIVGGGLVGCELGLWLAQKGHEVTIVEMAPFILGGPHSEIPFPNKDMLKDLLKFHGVSIYTDTKVDDIQNKMIKMHKGDEKVELDADTFVTAVGYQPQNTLYQELSSSQKQVYCIGDSRKVHNIMQAIWDGFEIGNAI